MINTQVMFTAPWQVEVQEDNYIVGELHPNEILVKKIYTLVSAGTELACLSGNEKWFSMPQVPGYSAVSEVINVGSSIIDYVIGDHIFHYGNHALYETINGNDLIVKVPEGVPLYWIPFARLATIAMTSIRVSSIELGDYVAVTGLGLVGNLAAQLASLQGANVVGIDVSANRLALAKRCGIFATLDGNDDQLIEQLSLLTSQIGVSTLIEATGVPQVVTKSLPYISPYGELILLGSPRGDYTGNITDLLNHTHLMDHGCITFKGAHEWRLPVQHNPYIKHSLVRNTKIVFELMKNKKLKIDPLISHIVPPQQEAEHAYEGLRNDKDQYHGVLFDWTKNNPVKEVKHYD